MLNPKRQECPIDLNSLFVPGSSFEHLMSNAPIMKTSMLGAIHSFLAYGRELFFWISILKYFKANGSVLLPFS